MTWSDFKTETTMRKKETMQGQFYLMAPYSSVQNKDALMKVIFTAAHDFMRKNPGAIVVSPLFYHPSVSMVPGVEGDWKFWGNYSISLLRRCDGTITVQYPGWMESTGMRGEFKVIGDLQIPIVAVYDEHGNQVQ